MLNLTRLFVLIAAAALLAQPVMACCMAGHGDAHALAVSTDASPCHDAREDMDHVSSDASHPMPSSMDCPGCLNCDSALMQAQSADVAVALASTTIDAPISILETRFDGFQHASTVLKTGPPGDTPLPLFTPITLKQRLLI